LNKAKQKQDIVQCYKMRAECAGNYQARHLIGYRWCPINYYWKSWVEIEQATLVIGSADKWSGKNESHSRMLHPCSCWI